MFDPWLLGLAQRHRLPHTDQPDRRTASTCPVPGGNLGLLLFGSSGPDSTPYGALGGKPCVAAPTVRTAPKTSGGDQGQCNGGYAFTLADLIAAAASWNLGRTSDDERNPEPMQLLRPGRG